MAMKVCKECKKEISSSAKKCPNCGKDQRNWFMRHKILTLIAAIAIIGIISAISGGDKDGTPNNTANNTTQAPETTAEVPDTTVEVPATTAEAPETTTGTKTTKFSDGKYLVGKDIQSGLYKVTVTDKITKMGYVERAKDLDMEMDSIIANIILTGNGYVEILSTDVAVKLQGVEIEPIKLEDLEPDIKNEVSDGIYLVGYDIAPGTYKVEVTDTITNMGYVERSRSVAMGMEDIIANEIIQGPGYVKIEQGDFAVRLQGVKISLQQ